MKRHSYLLLMITSFIAVESTLPIDTLQTTKSLDSYFTRLKRGIRCYFKKNCRKEDKEAVNDTIKATGAIIVTLLIAWRIRAGWLDHKKNLMMKEYFDLKSAKDIQSLIKARKEQSKHIPSVEIADKLLNEIANLEKPEQYYINYITQKNNQIQGAASKGNTEAVEELQNQKERYHGKLDNIQIQKTTLIDTIKLLINQADLLQKESILRMISEKNFNADTLQKLGLNPI